MSEESARVLEVNASAVFRYEGDDTATIVGRHDRDNIGRLSARRAAAVDEDTAIGQVLSTGAPARIDDYSGPPQASSRKLMLRIGYRSTVVGPDHRRRHSRGAPSRSRAPSRCRPRAEARLAAFCELVSLAVASAQARDDLRASRARIVKAGDEQRRKLERNLHDGAQQRLVSLALKIRLARAQLKTDPEAVAASLEAAAKELDLALEELRELARGLHPGALTEQGLGTALEGLSRRLPIRSRSTRPTERLPRGHRGDVYYIVSEALTNVVKHAQATRAGGRHQLEADVVRFEVTDDGRGGADPVAGTGHPRAA